MTRSDRFEEKRKLQEEIVRLKKDLEQASKLYDLEHPKLIEIAKRLDPPIARLMQLQLEEIQSQNNQE